MFFNINRLFIRRAAIVVGVAAAVIAGGVWSCQNAESAANRQEWFATQRAMIEATRRDLAATRAHALDGAHDVKSLRKHIVAAREIQARCVALVIEHNERAAEVQIVVIEPIEDAVCI